MMVVYEASPIKRAWLTKAEIKSLDDANVSVLASDHPMTVRQIFYQLVAGGGIDKLESQYSAVGRRLGMLRRAGHIPFDWIADNTRWMPKPRSFGSLEEALTDTARFYRRSLWSGVNETVEIWCEKDALAGVLYDVTAEYDVPLMVTRGYPSLSYIFEAAEAMRAHGKPANLYYFGDRDPSGVDIPRNIQQRLCEFLGENWPYCFQVEAVTREQIELFNLPTRPTKKSDSRAKKFKGESVELDAIPPNTLRGLVRECIERHIDHDALAVLQVAEASERHALAMMAREAANGAA